MWKSAEVSFLRRILAELSSAALASDERFSSRPLFMALMAEAERAGGPSR